MYFGSMSLNIPVIFLKASLREVVSKRKELKIW